MWRKGKMPLLGNLVEAVYRRFAILFGIMGGKVIAIVSSAFVKRLPHVVIKVVVPFSRYWRILLHNIKPNKISRQKDASLKDILLIEKNVVSDNKLRVAEGSLNEGALFVP